MDCEARYKYSAITSLAAALIALWLYIAYRAFVSPTVSLLAFLIFAADAYAKWVNDRSLRRITTVLFSLANAVLILAGFNYLGDPFSQVVALLWLVDFVLKLPGINTEWEGTFRHSFSAFMTIVFGLSILFSMRIFNSTLLSIVLGILVLGDAYVKINYVKDRCFVVQ